MRDDQTSTKDTLAALRGPPSGDELERAYGLAPHLLSDPRYRRTAFGRAQFLCLGIAGIAPLIGCYALGWSASIVVITLVIDAWAVHLGDLFVIGLAEQGQRRARHWLGLRNYVLRIARRTMKLVNNDTAVRNGSAVKFFIDLPGGASILLSTIILLFITAPVVMMAAITLRDHPGHFKPGWIILLCLLSMMVRLIAASRIGMAGRRDEISYQDLLPQGYAPSLALFAAGCAWAVVVINGEHRLSDADQVFYASLAFFVTYLLVLVAIAISLRRDNRDEARLLGQFLAVPQSLYQQRLNEHVKSP
jgi:hypothetical protein